MPNNYTLWFKEIDKEDVVHVGGKGANLGEMTKAGFPVPPGFVVTAHSYTSFLKENELAPKLKEILDPLDVENPDSLSHASSQIKRIINSSKVPDEVAKAIVHDYLTLNKEINKSNSHFHRLLSSLRSHDVPVA